MMARRSLFVGAFLLMFSAMCGAAIYYVNRAGGAGSDARNVFALLALISGIPGVGVMIGATRDPTNAPDADTAKRDTSQASSPDTPKCYHYRVEETALKGGAGPDEAAASCRCLDCHAHRWRYCDDTVSNWKPDTTFARVRPAE